MLLTSKKVYIKTIGCPLSRVSVAKIYLNLKKLGFNVLDSKDDFNYLEFCDQDAAIKADIFVFDTCVYLKTAEERIKKYIEQIRKRNTELDIIVTGCGATYKYSMIRKIKGLTTISKPYRVIEYLSNKYKPVCSNYKINKYDVEKEVLVKEGCSNYCSYCVVPYVRGPSKCIPYEIAMKEIEQKELMGFDQIHLVGICIGDWKDINKKFVFADLLRNILNKTKIKISELMIHPKDITDDLIELIGNERFDEKIYIPIQSGSDRILSKMNRGYDRKFLDKIFNKLYKRWPQIKIETDVIIGFPFETEKDFECTYNLLLKFPFYQVSVYKYSIRAGTRAAMMPQISEDVKDKRRDKVIKILNKKKIKVDRCF